jgi:hypothetical protein
MASSDQQSIQGGKAGGKAAGAIEDSQNDSHTRLACASAASHRIWRREKG